MNKDGISLQVKLIADGEDEDGNPTVVGLFDAIVEEASRSLQTRISSQADKLLENLVKDVAVKIIRERVGALVDSFLLNPIIPTDKYGQPKGEPTTLAEEVHKQLKIYLDEKVGRDGSSSYGDSSAPRIIWAARKAAAELGDAATKEHIAILKKEFTTHLTDRIATAAIK